MTMIRNWFWTFVAAGLVLIVCFGRCANAECLSSAAAVRATHGIIAWSTWRNVDGHKCWMEGKRKEVVLNGRLAARAIHNKPQEYETRPRPTTPTVGAIDLMRNELTSEYNCDESCYARWWSFQAVESMERLREWNNRASFRELRK